MQKSRTLEGVRVLAKPKSIDLLLEKQMGESSGRRMSTWMTMRRRLWASSRSALVCMSLNPQGEQYRKRRFMCWTCGGSSGWMMIGARSELSRSLDM